MYFSSLNLVTVHVFSLPPLRFVSKAMFTAQEATSFVQEKWGMERVQERFSDVNSRKGLLEDIVKQVHGKIPFQTISLLAVAPTERKRPTMSMIKEEGKAGIGGICYTVNVFTWGLLRGLGFSAYLCSATCTSDTVHQDTHVVVIVYNLEKDGDIHLVECGLGFPTFNVVPLNCEESPVFVDSFLEYKYIYHEGKYLRMHGKGDLMKRNNPPVEGLDFIVGKWRRFYWFFLKPSGVLSDFDAAVDQVFMPTFKHSPRAISFPSQRAVIIVNNRLKLEEEDGKMETTVLDGDEAIVDSYRRYFPSLQEDTVRRALKQWQCRTQQE